MPDFTVGGEEFRRKNLYIPCVIGERFDSMTDAEKAEVFKATYWADNIAASEWPVVLRHADAKRYNKARLKKKAAGWLMALGRISAINPALMDEITEQARALYQQQIEHQYPWGRLALGLSGLKSDEDDDLVILTTGRSDEDEDVA